MVALDCPCALVVRRAPSESPYSNAVQRKPHRLGWVALHQTQIRSRMRLTSEVVTDGGRGIGGNVDAHHALKRLALSRQRQHLGGLASIAAGNLEVNTRFDFAAVEVSYQCTAKFLHGNARESIPQWFAPHFLEFRPRVQMKRQPVESS